MYEAKNYRTRTTIVLIIITTAIVIVFGCNSSPSYINISSDTIPASIPKSTESSVNISSTVPNKLLSQCAFCNFYFIDKNGLEHKANSWGFILNGRYFVTCYHVLSFEGLALISATVFYNLKNDGSQPPSVDVDLNYHYTKNQYDFTKHKFDSTDRRSDVMILALKSRINSTPISISNSRLKANETLYGMQQDATNSVLVEGKVLFEGNFFGDTTTHFPIILGKFKHGSSGSPVFDSIDNIISMECFGYDTFTDYVKAFNPPNNALLQRIKKAYESGYNVSVQINIRYIMKRYGKGFF